MTDELSDKQKFQIQRYLGSLVNRWLAWLGIANITTLAAALIYVFFILPDKAVSEAVAASSARLDAQTQRLEEKLPDIYELSGKLSHSVDEAQRTITSLHKKGNQIAVDLSAVEQKLIRLKAKPEYEVVKAIEELDKADEASEILEGISDINKKLKGLEELESDVKQLGNRVSLGSTCVVIDKMQICWGRSDVQPDPNSPHTAAFSFQFEKPFLDQPTITNGINTRGPGHALGVYTWSATSTGYNGRLNNMYIGEPIRGSVTMQYIAIGPAG